MITKEQYEMIAMCALALRDGKMIQSDECRNFRGWRDTACDLHAMIGNILDGRYIYRIKPEPKTMLCRVYFEPNTKAILVAAAKVSSGFWDSTTTQWLTDEFTVELPE